MLPKKQHSYRLAFTGLFLLLYGLGSAQPQTDWNAFYQKVDISAYRGMKFKLQAAVRVEPIDENAEAELWVRIDNADQSRGFFENMTDRPIRKKEWEVYSIEGVVDKLATALSFGGQYYHKGIFCFDDFHLTVQNKTGDWDEVPLAETGFESYPDVIDQTWHYMTKPSPYIPSLSSENVYKGRKSLRIDGRNATPVKPYGSNDSAGRYVGVNGIRIYYEQYGKGSPVLLLHDNRGSLADWAKQIPDLSERFQVIAVDSRGQGASTAGDRPYSYDLFAEDMDALLQELHLDSVYVLGWGDGANTGLILAQRFPKKVRKLAIMSGRVYNDETVVDRSEIRILQEQKDELKGDNSARARNELKLIQLLEKGPNHFFSEIEHIQCPVLVMAGQEDIVKESHTRDIASHITHAELDIFAGGTHFVPVEASAEFNKKVIDFFLVN